MSIASFTKVTQADLILAHLYSLNDEGKRRGLTQMEALGLYRITRLAARIEEIRKRGHNIVPHRRKDNTGKSYVRYFLVGD